MVILSVACICGCAQPLSKPVSHSPQVQLPLAKTPKYRVNINDANGGHSHFIGQSVEYRMNEVLIAVGDEKLRADDKILTELTESDIVTIDAPRTVSVNGVRVWPANEE